jgi:GDPmannose 4,6-dehydratase
LILQQPVANDFVIATGKSHSLAEFVQCAFQCVGLNWEQFVETDATIFRPAEIRYSYADPSLAERVLGWRAVNQVHDVVRLMLDAELGTHSSESV